MQSTTMSGGIVNEKIYLMFSYSTTICSCFLNSLLIFAIVVTRARHIGPYRFMLLSFAIIDCCISLTHTAILPVAHMTEFGIICWPYRFLQMPTVFGFWSMLFWVFLIYQTFILLAFHYVYRFVLLCKPPWISRIQRKPWRNWITIAVFADFIYAGTIVYVASRYFNPSDKSRHAFGPLIKFLHFTHSLAGHMGEMVWEMKRRRPELYNIDLFANNLPGYLALAAWMPLQNGEKEWQTAQLAAISVVSGFICASVAVILYCIRKITSAAVKEKHLESKTRLMQQQLFRALLWQTIIPALTSYAPAGFMVLTPIVTGSKMGGMGTIALMSMQLFPMIDPCLIIFFVPRYRAALPRCLRRTGIVPFKISVLKSTESLQNARHTTAPDVLSS